MGSAGLRYKVYNCPRGSMNINPGPWLEITSCSHVYFHRRLDESISHMRCLQQHEAAPSWRVIASTCLPDACPVSSSSSSISVISSCRIWPHQLRCYSLFTPRKTRSANGERAFLRVNRLYFCLRTTIPAGVLQGGWLSLHISHVGLILGQCWPASAKYHINMACR